MGLQQVTVFFIRPAAVQKFHANRSVCRKKNLLLLLEYKRNGMQANGRYDMIETGTNYSLLIKVQQAPVFQKVKACADQFMRDLPEEQQAILLDELKRGAGRLDTEPLMAADLHANGDIREARLQRAFTHLSRAFLSEEIELIDYDCGQATGAMIYHDFLQNMNLYQTIRRITLIDASETCLKRAALHVQRFFPQAEIRVLCKPTDELQAEDILSADNRAKLHLLTGILNLNIASITRLAAIMQANMSGYNQFICTGAYYGESAGAMMDTFVNLMNADSRLTIAEDLTANRMIPGKPWTCALRVFAKDGTGEGHFITEETTTCWISEAGIKYSEDKHALIEYPRTLGGEYIVPDTVTTIDGRTFRGCEHLNRITAGNAAFKSIDGVLYSHDMSRLIKYPAGKEGLRYVVPRSVQTIGPYAFAGCMQLQSVILPDSVTTIGHGAFENCERLRNMVIPESVTRIEGHAFIACTSLATLILNAHHCDPVPDKSPAFEGCHALTTIHIGSQVQAIPDSLFSHCESIYSVILPGSVTYIGAHAFSHCKQLESVTLPPSLTIIGKEAFEGCGNLRSILVPKGKSSFFGKFEALRKHASSIAEEESAKPAEEDDEEEEIPAAEPAEKEKTPLSDFVRQLLAAARQGNSKAQNNLGYLYETGKDVRQDDAEAVKWYRKAAEQGHAKAQYNLASHYSQGRGIPRDEKEAARWYLEAARNGLGIAMTHLGVRYATGNGVGKDDAEAVKWYRKAAEQGDETAIRNLRKRGIHI
jgi:hypothetical protein